MATFVQVDSPVTVPQPPGYPLLPASGFDQRWQAGFYADRGDNSSIVMPWTNEAGGPDLTTLNSGTMVHQLDEQGRSRIRCNDGGAFAIGQLPTTGNRTIVVAYAALTAETSTCVRSNGYFIGNGPSAYGAGYRAAGNPTWNVTVTVDGLDVVAGAITALLVTIQASTGAVTVQAKRGTTTTNVGSGTVTPDVLADSGEIHVGRNVGTGVDIYGVAGWPRILDAGERQAVLDTFAAAYGAA